MKKHLFLFAFLLMAMSAYSQSRVTYECTDNNVNVRQGPGTNYAVIQGSRGKVQIFKGDRVESDGQQSNGFIHVYCKNTSGWVSAQYLKTPGSSSVSSGKVMELTSNNFYQFTNTNKLVVLDFYTTWCGPCRMLAPVLEDLAKEYSGRVVFGRIDAEAEVGLASRFEVTHYPSVIIIKNNRCTGYIGYREKPEWRQIINSYLR